MDLINFDIDSLTIEDAKVLIAAEKNPSNLLEYNRIYRNIVETLVAEREEYVCTVNDNVRNIEYKFRTFMAADPSREHFSIGLRIPYNNLHLIRFDFGSTLKHTNNFKTDHEDLVSGSHVHILSLADKMACKNVIPIDDIAEYKNLKRISDVFLRFVEDSNIRVKK